MSAFNTFPRRFPTEHWSHCVASSIVHKFKCQLAREELEFNRKAVERSRKLNKKKNTENKHEKVTKMRGWRRKREAHAQQW
jgi:hypothetical protein